jgi:hypothetical protein
MIRVHLVQVNKMFAIEGYQNARFRHSKRQHIFIGYCLSRLTAFVAG